MFFTKYPHPANFSFVSEYDPESGRARIGERDFVLKCTSYEGGYWHIGANNADVWLPNLSLQPLDTPAIVKDNSVCIGAAFDLALRSNDGRTLVETVPGEGFGVSGEASLFQFVVPPDAAYFGMGEKCFGKLELSGIRTKFWSTDVWSDFHWGQWGSHPVDPPYFSTPYLAVQSATGWIGFLLHNPGVTFMETPGNDQTRVFVEWQRTANNLILGSENGEPNLWVFHAPNLAELTRKLQNLVGKTPLPPLWSLGFHQSRWGYGGHKDLLELDSKFEKYETPCSGLWLDLDYMDGYRIFKTDIKQFPHGAQATTDALKKNDRRIVPIIDPGVKKEAGYSVYDDGMEAGVFCKNTEGAEYVGLVWPGETVFPDFTQPAARTWWKRYAKDFRASGFGAAWVDMNDPSTGPVDPTDMLFNDGREAHALHRNQYALGMQMATIEGFLEARPNERPFLLSRSGFIGSSRYSAVWTGDNLSNEHYLKQSIPTTLGMAISGLPFNGPDLGGFGGDADDELMVRWFQACLLFPFYRNHSTLDSRLEEPWRYPAKIRKLITHAIRLRYQFLPYLYQLFIAQEETGDAMVRPLIYDFNEPALSNVDHQYMVGSNVMQAPIVELGKDKREVVLPGDEPWFDLAHGKWIDPGVAKVRAKLAETPIYARNGAIIPLQPELPATNQIDLTRPMFLLCGTPGTSGALTYSADDGLTFDYRQGVRSTIQVSVEWTESGVQVTTQELLSGYGRIVPTWLLPDPDTALFVNGSRVSVEPTAMTLAGRELNLGTSTS